MGKEISEDSKFELSFKTLGGIGFLIFSLVYVKLHVFLNKNNFSIFTCFFLSKYKNLFFLCVFIWIKMKIVIQSFLLFWVN